MLLDPPERLEELEAADRARVAAAQAQAQARL